MKRLFLTFAVSIFLFACLSGCGQQSPTATISQSELPAESSQTHPADSDSFSSGGVQQPLPAESTSHPAGEISAEDALSIALDNADVPKADAYNIKNERDGDNGIPIYDIEFETDYGDYDFEVAIADGRIVGADYEVDEEWLDAFGGSAVSLEDARALVSEKVPGSNAGDVQIWEESEDGRGRYGGELFFNGMKYEFEIDPRMGRIYDWNADLRD